MNGFKGTPAPWWGAGMEVGTEPAMDVKIARVSGANIEEAKANLRLIAAAPELLDALQSILYARTQERGLQNTAPGESPLHDKCKAAIIKAGGRVL